MKVISIFSFLLLFPLTALNQTRQDTIAPKIEVTTNQSELINAMRFEIEESERLQAELNKVIQEENARESKINKELIRLISE